MFQGQYLYPYSRNLMEHGKCLGQGSLYFPWESIISSGVRSVFVRYSSSLRAHRFRQARLCQQQNNPLDQGLTLLYQGLFTTIEPVTACKGPLHLISMLRVCKVPAWANHVDGLILSRSWLNFQSTSVGLVRKEVLVIKMLQFVGYAVLARIEYDRVFLVCLSSIP